MTLHIYTANKQPATKFVDTAGNEPLHMGFAPDKLIYTDCCGKKRKAANCVVQCYYDHLAIWCADGHGCKHPVAMQQKSFKAHINRSRAQQGRRARERYERTQAK